MGEKLPRSFQERLDKYIVTNCPYFSRAPPSDLILTYQNQNQIGEITLKEINLRKYYPYYTQDKIVSVPDEVAQLLRELTRSMPLS